MKSRTTDIYARQAQELFTHDEGTKVLVATDVNCAESYILAIVQVENDQAIQPVYVRAPFVREPDFGVTRSDYKIKEILERGGPPR